MATINERYFDAALRHQIGVRRFASGEVNRILALLETADAELAAKIRTRLGSLAGKPFALKSTDLRLRRLLKDVRSIRSETMASISGEIRESLFELSPLEAQFEIRMIEGALFPVQVDLIGVPAAKLRSIVTTKPFSVSPGGSKNLNGWFNTLKRADQARLDDAIRLGVVQGETVDQMMQRVAGTRSRGFTDGVLATSRRNAEAIVRTGVNHVSNAARETVWEENKDIISLLAWNATLDGRTTPICRARDGKVTTVSGESLPANVPASKKLQPPGARPPAHVSCRSLMSAILSGQKIAGSRPFVMDTRTGKARQVDFRRMAKSQGIKVETARKRWADRVVGRQPADVTYNDWLKRQPAAFQDEVLGNSKGALFRRGKLPLDKFVDRKGSELTLKQLAKTQPDAFDAANLNVEDFL